MLPSYPSELIHLKIILVIFYLTSLTASSAQVFDLISVVILVRDDPSR